MNWSDLRAFLALAQHGSLRHAADMLAVTQPTIARRIRMLEADVGLPLFERDHDGHRLTAAGAQLLPDIRAVETAALRVEKRCNDLLGSLTETVRIGAGEWGAGVLARGLATLADGPQIELLVTSDFPASISRKPEIQVRHGIPASGPTSGNAVTRRIGALSCAVYGDPAFAVGRILPLSPADIATLPWLGFVEEQEHYITMRWMRDQMRDRPPAARLMNTDLMITAAMAGVGVAILPCYLGNAVPGLVRLTAPIDALRADYWTVTDPDLSQNPSIRAVTSWIADCFQAVEHAAGDGGGRITG